VNFMGIWDLRVSSPSLGGLLILLQKLTLLSRDAGSGCFDLGFVGPWQTLCEEGKSPLAPGGIITQETVEASPVLASLVELEGMGQLMWAHDRGDWEEGRRVVLANTLDNPRHEKVLWIQQYYERTGVFPQLSFCTRMREKARAMLRNHSAGFASWVVHLKDDGRGKGNSNADLSAWRRFFERCEGQYPVRFLLIGDRPPGQFADAKNVVSTRSLGGSLPLDLALINEAQGFMGMASGPCQMAVFGTNPYAVFKNPDHHPEEMAEQIGAADRFSFALSSQRILRVSETPEILLDVFHDLFQNATR
jgi:hypothetical protein